MGEKQIQPDRLFQHVASLSKKDPCECVHPNERETYICKNMHNQSLPPMQPREGKKAMERLVSVQSGLAKVSAARE